MKAQTFQNIFNEIQEQANTTKNLVAFVITKAGEHIQFNFSTDEWKVEKEILFLEKETGTDWIDIDSIVSVSI